MKKGGQSKIIIILIISIIIIFLAISIFSYFLFKDKPSDVEDLEEILVEPASVPKITSGSGSVEPRKRVGGETGGGISSGGSRPRRRGGGGSSSSSSPGIGCTVDEECSDGLYCNGEEKCVEGECLVGELEEYDDEIECTVDNCDEEKDEVTHTPNHGSCQDGLYCNGAEVCDVIEDCKDGTDPNCDDEVSCTVDSCEEGDNKNDNAGQCLQDTSDCRCEKNSDCDDSNSCTDDICTDQLTCSKVNNDKNTCDDGFFCIVSDHCSEGRCVGDQRQVDDEVSCTLDSCDEVIDEVVHIPKNSRCDNGLYCDGAEVCHVTDDCQVGIPPSIDDGVGCTVDSCNEESNTIINTPDNSLCQNGLFCDGAEVCHLTEDCKAGTPPSIDDEIDCTVDSCNEETDTIDHSRDDNLCENYGCQVGSCSENGCEFQTNPSCNRPESKIVSDEDEDIEGTLEMKWQRKEGDSWITKETISENIVVPAKGIVRLDLGRDNLGNNLFEGWNEKNIVAAVNEEGYYRVYASFAMEGKETIEDSWKIKVEGNSELGTISLFGRFIEWLKSLVVKKDEINFKNYGELAQTGGGGDVDVEISIATIKDDYNTEEQILLTPTEMPEEECQYSDPDIDIPVTNLQNPNYLESIIDPSFCGEIKRITDKNPNRIINGEGDDIGKWGTIVKNGYVTNTPWNINDELLFLISKNPGFRMTVYVNSFLPKKKELVKNSNVRWSKNLLIPYMQFAFPNNAEYYYKWDVNVGYNRDTMEGIEKIDLPFKVLKTPKLDTAYFNGKEYIAVPGIQDDTGDVYIYLIELSNVDSPVVTSYKLENPNDIILHSFRFSPDAKHVIYAYDNDLWRILDIDLDSKLIYPHELPSNPSNCGSSCKNTDLSNGYFSFEWGHPILGYGSDQDVYIVGQNARWNKKILEGVEGIKEDNKLGRVGAYNVNDKKYKSLTHPDRINSEEEFEEVGESEPFHFSIEKGYGFIAYAKFTSGAGRGPKYQNELLAIDIVNPSNGIYRLGYHRANQANGIDYQVFPSASHDLKNLIFSSSWGDDQSQVNSYIIDLDLPKIL